jgi:O-antigen ligase
MYSLLMSFIYIKKKNYKIVFIDIPSFITALLPFFLITGPFLSDLAISICAIIFFVNSFFSSLKRFFFSKFFLFFLIFWFTLILSSLLSTDKIYSLNTSLLYIRFGIFSLSTWFLLVHNKMLIKYFYYVFLFCFFILIFDGFFQFFTGFNIFGWKIVGTRVSSLFGSELVLGSYISRLMPLFFAIFIYLKKSNLNKTYNTATTIVIFILLEVLIFLSGERVSFFYLNLSALFCIFLFSEYKIKRFFMLASSLLLIMLISKFYPESKERIFDLTKKQIFQQTENQTILFKNIKLNIFSVEHENHYKSAILMFKENKILGIGTKLFRKNCNEKKFRVSEESCSTHPHNTYIQLLAETGIVGFFQVFTIFLILIYFSIKHFFFKFIKKNFLFNDFQIAILSAFLITLWPLAPTGNFFGNWINVIYYLPVGFLIFSLDRKSLK